MQGRLCRVARCLLLAGALCLVACGPAAAQLANTNKLDDTAPWPMFQHDVQHTGRSSFLGPLFPSGSPVPADVTTWQATGKITSSPTIGADATIYVGVDVPGAPNHSGTGFICAINSDLSQKWCTQLRADASQSTPAIGVADNGAKTLYLGDRDNTVDAVDPTGAILWYYNHGFEGDILTSPTIGSKRESDGTIKGTIYVVPIQNLYGPGPVTALNPDGTLKWKYVIGKYVDASSPAIDQSGNIYVGDLNGGLHKFTDAGTRLWKVTVGLKITASPVIGDDGTIYIGSTNGFSALSPADGHVLWNIAAGTVEQTAALGADGTVYFTAKSGQYRAIYAVAPDGRLRWQYGPVVVASPYAGFPIVGRDGIVYVGFGNGLYAFSPDGALLWNYQTGGVVTSFPAIAGTASKESGGTAVIYVAASDWKLYAISGPRHGLDTNATPVVDAGLDQSGVVGQVLNFQASASDADSDILSYTWTFGDGTAAHGPTAHHVYVTPRSYTVTLTVSDGLSVATDTLTAAIAPAGGTPPFSDSFNRADSDSVGNGWQEAQGDLGIKQNELRNAPLKATHVAIQPALSGLDHTAAASFASVDNNTGPRLGVVLRFLDPLNYYVLYRQMGGSSQLRISRVTNGIETILKTAPVTQAALNSFFRLSGDASGRTLTLRLCTATDTSTGAQCVTTAQTLTVIDSALAGGSVGVLIGTGTGSTQQYRVDNFAAQVR